MQPTQNATTQNSLKVPSLENLPRRKVLSVQERESLKQTANVFGYADAVGKDNFIPGSNGAAPVDVPWLKVNRPRLNAQQKQVMEVLRNGTPETTTPQERDRLDKLAKELEPLFTDPEWFQTRQECRVLKRDKPEYFTALDKAKAWSKPQARLGGRTPEELAMVWRNIKRTLEPDDEMAGSLDRLRKDK